VQSADIALWESNLAPGTTSDSFSFSFPQSVSFMVDTTPSPNGNQAGNATCHLQQPQHLHAPINF